MPTNPATPQTVPLVTGEEIQGVYLLGNFADGFSTGSTEYLSVVAPANMRIGVNVQSLVIRNASGATPGLPWYLPVAAPNTGTLRIDAIGATGYNITYIDAGGAESAYCDTTESPDAVAMLGKWTSIGEHDLDPVVTKVTFACQESGKAAKCITWGYPPGTAGEGDVRWDLHQVCTQAARANYCWDGKSHTREKTPIVIRDFATWTAIPPDSGATELPRVPASYPPVPPPPDRYFYEAAWAPRQPVLCLSKLRWADSDPGNLCDGKVKDPRLDKNAKYCEDAHFDFNEINLINASRTMDMALHRWWDGSGDTLTTVHGFIVNAAKPNNSVPPAGFNAPSLANEGYLLRNLTGEFATCGCVFKVYQQRNPNTGDTVVGPPNMLPDYQFNPNSDFEGWLINAPADDRRALYLYKNGTDYVTSTAIPAKPPTGFKPVGGLTAAPIGYVIAASQLN